MRWFLALALALRALAQPVVEFRGAWLARDSLGSRAEIARAMDALAEANFNVAFVDFWSRGYPAWPSEVFQRHTGVLGDPGWPGRDLVQESIEEGRRAGIRVVAWMEYGFVGGWSGYFPGASGKGRIFDAHPEWLARTSAGGDAFAAPSGSFYWMIHTRPDVQQFLLDLAGELVSRYRLDGVQFDRLRYPQTDCGYDDFTLDLYRQENQGQPPPTNPNDPEWMRWRAEKLNAFVRELYLRVKRARLGIPVSNAPGVFPSAYTSFLQDYPSWLREGLLDYVVPQIYRRTDREYQLELDRQLAVAPRGFPLVPGVDITNSNDPEDLARQIESTRARGLPGVVIWYQVALERAGAFPVLRERVFQEKAEAPFAPPPLPPRSRGLNPPPPAPE